MVQRMAYNPREDKAEKTEAILAMQGNPRETVDMAYAAGIIDGEGYVGIIKTYVKGKDKTNRFDVKVQVNMVDLQAPTYLCDLYGGKVIQRARRKINWRPTHTWTLVEKVKIEAMLVELMPYLKTKKVQARLALDFISECPMKRRGKTLVSVSELLKREEFHQEMKKLNLRGVPATTKRVGTREGEVIV